MVLETERKGSVQMSAEEAAANLGKFFDYLIFFLIAWLLYTLWKNNR